MTRASAREGKRRILFNWDGTEAPALIGDDHRPDTFLEHVFDRVE